MVRAARHLRLSLSCAKAWAGHGGLLDEKPVCCAPVFGEDGPSHIYAGRLKARLGDGRKSMYFPVSIDEWRFQQRQSIRGHGLKYWRARELVMKNAKANELPN